MSGRPSKSEDLHKLQGTKPEVKALGTSNVSPGRPKFPKHLGVEARRAMKRVCGFLETRRALTPGDRELLATYGVLYERWLTATEKLRIEGEVRLYTRLDSNGQAHDVEKVNLWLPIAQASEKSMVAILDRLGLTPLAKDKVKPASKGDREPVDPMEEFLSHAPNVLPINPQRK